MFGLLSLAYAIIFMLNSIVILNEKRFLNRVCLPLSSEHRSYLDKRLSKVVDFLNAVRTVFEIPLIALNIFFIVYELLLG